MPIDTTKRSSAPEIMDDFAMEGEILRDALEKIAKINHLLGGNKITLDGVKKLLENKETARPIRIVDIGCGNGDMLRMLANYASNEHLKFELIGIDANPFTVKCANELSTAYPNISFECKNIFEGHLPTCDILLCTLTLHHFSDSEIINLLESFKQSARVGIIINDLHRSKLAYHLFNALCFVFRLNYMSRADGLISILRGFKKADLESYAKQLNTTNCSIRWKWAFRYQWIIKTT
jgi:SAM-dependent methyltransferase